MLTETPQASAIATPKPNRNARPNRDPQNEKARKAQYESRKWLRLSDEERGEILDEVYDNQPLFGVMLSFITQAAMRPGHKDEDEKSMLARVESMTVRRNPCPQLRSRYPSFRKIWTFDWAGIATNIAIK